ncbi:MAG TPA: xanthine dehydrogenase family protein molybdopterin-binding subunit [Spirochaetia bacterium]|nr:xanthine dehydrogenase family protein molybdopterin-binding subunit [Spirochaetia bacterium]
MRPNVAFRNDARAKVTGRATYADDISIAGMLYAAPVYADYVSARDLVVDSSEALASPGCVRVITAADVPGTASFGQIEKDYPILCSGRVRSYGDVCALVVAETRAAAKAAAALVKVTATPVKPVLTIDEALEPGAPVVPSYGDTNVVTHHRLRHGDPEPAFDGCELVLEEEFTTQAIEHAYMEPETAVCVPRSDGVVEVYGSMQHPFSTRRFVAALLGEPLSNVEVYTISVGGGFGGKDDTAAAVCARAALAARLTGRPVKLRYDREWSFRESYKRHPYRMRYKVGVSSEGRVLAVKATMHADSGAYLSVTPWVTWRSTAQCFGPYVVDDIHADVYGVATNNVFTGAMRGFGAPQVNFAVEQLMDMAAHELKIHPLGMRRINMVKQDSVTVTGQRLDGHVVSMEDVMNRVVHEIGYRKKYEHCSFGKPADEGSDELYGIGLAISYRGASLGAEGMDFCSCIINGQYDGSILLETGIHENGQGSESAMTLILADELGVDLGRVRYKRSSTSSIPDSGTTVATRGTVMGGSAVVVAAGQYRELLSRHLADRLRCRPEDVTFHDDKIWGLNYEYSLTWEEAMRELFLQRVTPYAFGTFQAPPVSWDDTTGQGDAYFTYVYSCQAVELTVDRKTGKIRLLNVVAGHDIGKAVNRALLLGQVYGGVTQGVGMALMEDFAYEDGKPACENFDKYLLPRATDLPEMTGVIIENHDPNSLTGAKGIGEPALELIAPAIANAVFNATGVRCRDLPIRLRPEDLA